MEQYWIYRDGYLRGPFPASELVKLEDFTGTTMVCRFGDPFWLPACHVREIQESLIASQNQVIESGDYTSPAPPTPDSIPTEETSSSSRKAKSH